MDVTQSVTFSLWLNKYGHQNHLMGMLYETFVQKTGQMNFSWNYRFSPNFCG
jgi:hypothetical protein